MNARNISCDKAENKEESKAHMSIKAGQIIGDYQVLGRLGAGGIGEVFKVRHLISDRIEAMKVLLADSVSEELPERFLAEIRTLARLQHPHIAGLHTALRDGDQFFMVMEYVEGETLRSRLSRSLVSSPDATRYVLEVLSALEYAHAMGVIHRDIKPANIMITPRGQSKLLDFGLAITGVEHDLTKEGTILGSLQYMSPEQVLGTNVDCRSDIYSTGITFYELLAGKLPSRGTTDYQIMRAHLELEFPPLHGANVSVPKDLSDIVAKAVALDPSARFQTAREFATELKPFAESRIFDLPTMSIQRPSLPERAANPGSTSGATPKSPESLSDASAGDLKGSGSSGSKHLENNPSVPKGDSHLMGVDAEALALVTRELALYVGPIARVLVNRSAPHCANLHELYLRVADEIESDAARAKFLANRRRTR